MRDITWQQPPAPHPLTAGMYVCVYVHQHKWIRWWSWYPVTRSHKPTHGGRLHGAEVQRLLLLDTLTTETMTKLTFYLGCMDHTSQRDWPDLIHRQVCQLQWPSSLAITTAQHLITHSSSEVIDWHFKAGKKNDPYFRDNHFQHF